MPATRTETLSSSIKYLTTARSPSNVIDAADCDMYYPNTSALRSQFRTAAGKRVTPHQWAVYDFTRTIPVGKVVTYKDVCQAVGGSPRSVGGALRTNPFAPFVPCHRVIASSLFIGGFLGEWGKEHRTGTQCDRKLDLLAKEGVAFTEEGYLKGKETLWKGDPASN
ncbi:DNA binding methylated-DNA-cysteine S-methyltransferase [Mycena sanguinolenta]|uniref:Methylated-DNA--protein-cysteine methyltransferase n=1 Tax=Mycena sanguinolenta TaxID=230812 RepID=A0A8H7CY83_9AGAR|nr:DNA binding methylated-DNA-cysteine S-methyltransferase [Mycena sanguinolenta]